MEVRYLKASGKLRGCSGVVGSLRERASGKLRES